MNEKMMNKYENHIILFDSAGWLEDQANNQLDTRNL